LDDPDRLLDTGGGSLIKSMVGSGDEASDAAQEAGEAVINAFDRDGGQFMSEESRDFWQGGMRFKDAAKEISLLQTAQFDLSRATSFLTDKYGEMGISVKGARNSLKALGGEFLRVYKVTLKAIKASFVYIGSTLKQMYTDGVLATIKSKLSFAKLANAAATYAENSALLTYIGTAISATIANYGLAASITAVTGGLNILLAVLGALAVGIITNFDKIKGSASGMLSGIMPIFSALKEILLTVFVETWNIIVSAISSLKTAFMPLISIIMDFVGIFTTLFGMNQKTGDSFLTLSNIVDVVIGVLQTVSDAIQLVFGVLGTLGSIVGTVIRVHLFPLTLSLQLIAAGLRAAYEAGKNFIDNVLRSTTGSGISKTIGKVIKVVNDLRKGFDELPDNIETALNTIIDKVNSFIKKLNESVPYLELRTIDRVEVTGGGLETSRQELSRDTERVGDDLARIAPNVINMKEENNQTVNQSIDADPEDKSTVSRVVEDAIERANRFERTRAGQ
jgi:hypothetical protein